MLKESTQSDNLRLGVLILEVVLIEVNGEGLVEFQRTGHSIGSLGTTDHLLLTSLLPVLTFSINRGAF